MSQLDDDTRIGLLKHTVVMNPNFVSMFRLLLDISYVFILRE